MTSSSRVRHSPRRGRARGCWGPSAVSRDWPDGTAPRHRSELLPGQWVVTPSAALRYSGPDGQTDGDTHTHTHTYQTSHLNQPSPSRSRASVGGSPFEAAPPALLLLQLEEQQQGGPPGCGEQHHLEGEESPASPPPVTGPRAEDEEHKDSPFLFSSFWLRRNRKLSGLKPAERQEVPPPELG